MFELQSYFMTATKRQKRLLMIVGIAVLVAFIVFILYLLATPAYANGDIDTIFTKIETSFTTIHTKLGIVVSALAVLAMGFCAFKWILSTDPQAVRQAKQWMLYIAIGVAVYWLAGPIVNGIKSVVNTAG